MQYILARMIRWDRACRVKGCIGELINGAGGGQVSYGAFDVFHQQGTVRDKEDNTIANRSNMDTYQVFIQVLDSKTGGYVSNGFVLSLLSRLHIGCTLFHFQIICCYPKQALHRDKATLAALPFG